MLHRQKIAQTKAEHKGNRWRGAVQQHGSADFFFIQENEKGCRAAVEQTTPTKGPKQPTLERTPRTGASPMLRCLFDLVVFCLLQPERMKAY